MVLDPNPLPACTRWSRKVILCSVAEVRVPARFLNKRLSWFWTSSPMLSTSDACITAVVIDNVIHIARTRQRNGPQWTIDSRQSSRPVGITFTTADRCDFLPGSTFEGIDSKVGGIQAGTNFASVLPDILFLTQFLPS